MKNRTDKGDSLKKICEVSFDIYLIKVITYFQGSVGQYQKLCQPSIKRALIISVSLESSGGHWAVQKFLFGEGRRTLFYENSPWLGRVFLFNAIGFCKSYGNEVFGARLKFVMLIPARKICFLK